MSLDYFKSIISRNLEGWPTPEMIAATDDPVERHKLLRVNAFARGALVFYPFMQCQTCDTTYDLADFPAESFKFSEDPEEATMPCPGCFQPNNVVMRVSAMHMAEGKELPYKKVMLNTSLDKDNKAIAEHKLAEFEPAEYTEEVQMLGYHQMTRRFLQLAMSTPLILINNFELIKQQHTLAYNLYITYPDFASAVCNLRTLAVALLSQADAMLYSSVSTTTPSLHEFVDKNQHMEPQVKIVKQEEEPEDYVQLKSADFVEPKPAFVVVWHNWRSMQTSVANELRAAGQTVDPSRERHDFSIEAFTLNKDGTREVVDKVRVAKVGLDKNLEPVHNALNGLLADMVDGKQYTLIRVFVPLDLKDLLLDFVPESVVEYPCNRLVPELCKAGGISLTQAKQVLMDVYQAEIGGDLQCAVCMQKLGQLAKERCANCGVVSAGCNSGGMPLWDRRLIDWDATLGPYDSSGNQIRDMTPQEAHQIFFATEEKKEKELTEGQDWPKFHNSLDQAVEEDLQKRWGRRRQKLDSLLTKESEDWTRLQKSAGGDLELVNKAVEQFLEKRVERQSQCDYCVMIQVAGPIVLSFCTCDRMPEGFVNYRERIAATFAELSMKTGDEQKASFTALETHPPQDEVQEAIHKTLKENIEVWTKDKLMGCDSSTHEVTTSMASLDIKENYSPNQ